MSHLDIPPHSKRATRLALGVLALVAVASFAEGMFRQQDLTGPAPPPPPPGGQIAIAEARPAAEPALQTTATKPHRPAVADEPAADQTDATSGEAAAGSPAQPAPAADAAATAPEAPPSPPPPTPSPSQAPDGPPT